ncbi:hypothetical protein [Marinobacter shengliensis]|uniref:hypothetical protein n=1 Tax=Marinobacter shengliensis TaxID=1389223 RepID=UPI001109D7AD|nr:hypothetical protein [Marinobacter shengliensis]
MAEDSKAWLERIWQKIKRVGGTLSEDALEHKVRGMVVNGVAATHNGWKALDQETKNKLANDACEVALNTDDYNSLKDLIASYNKRDRAAIDERRLLRKIENGQGLRALIWRTLTTLVAVSIVFGAYALAAKYEIPLPLSRFPLNGT